MGKGVINILKQHKLRRTRIRTQVLEVFLSEGNKAIAHPEMERLLPHADRITLYRTLKTFEEKGIIHQVVDGGNAAKYALCHDTCTEHEHHDEHAHFHCQDCGKTICLESAVQPTVQVPQGFSIRQTHLVLEGVCNECDD